MFSVVKAAVKESFWYNRVRFYQPQASSSTLISTAKCNRFDTKRHHIRTYQFRHTCDETFHQPPLQWTTSHKHDHHIGSTDQSLRSYRQSPSINDSITASMILPSLVFSRVSYSFFWFLSTNWWVVWFMVCVVVFVLALRK